ncbi:radical SAM protein [Paraburkholderia sp. Clong3]|uniref:radical SAM protein n=1 Tax=Paraburkholderia sp. Clong3 TaxID=2991061 RepID=UPI003D19EB64
MVHLLGRCNLRCGHCYMEGAPERTEVLPFEHVAAAVRESESLGAGAIYLTGGEPLLYRRLPEILRIASNETRSRLIVCTNGTLMTQR